MPPPPRHKASPPPRKVQADKSGLRVPGNLLGSWARRSEVQYLVSRLGEVINRVKASQKSGDKFYSRVSFNSVLSHLEQAVADLQVAKPAYVCPVCGGNPEVSKACNLCKGIGLLGEWHWQAVPEELKQMRKIAVTKQL